MRASPVASRYDNLFEGADWYSGLAPEALDEKPKESAPAAAPVPEHGEISRPAPAPAPELGTKEIFDEIAAQKQRMLEQFLKGVPAMSSSSTPAPAPSSSSEATTDATPAPAVSSPLVLIAPPLQVAATSDSSSSGGGGSGSGGGGGGGGGVGGGSPASCSPASCSNGGGAISGASPGKSPGAMLVKSFMSELTELASIVEKTSTEVIQDSMRSQDLSRSLDTSLESAERCEATAAAANRPLRPLSDSSKPRKRLRLEEMRVGHVLSCLRRLGLPQHCAAFEACGIDGAMCDLLDEELLRLQLGMEHPGHRTLFLQWVRGMQRPLEGGAAAAPASAVCHEQMYKVAGAEESKADEPT